MKLNNTGAIMLMLACQWLANCAFIGTSPIFCKGLNAPKCSGERTLWDWHGQGSSLYVVAHDSLEAMVEKRVDKVPCYHCSRGS